MADGHTQKPPVDVEQWVDFVIASAAHRSGNAGHAKFGDALVQRYFASLPERYKEDPVASAYFDDMLCAVASAVRGFSVARDAFQTRVGSIRAAKDAELKRAERLDALSPLTKESVWGKAAATVAALGLWVPIQSDLKGKLASESLAWLGAAALAVMAAVLGLVLLVYWLQGGVMRRVERAFPDEVNAQWESRALADYGRVLERFVPIAADITERHYPGGSAGKVDTGKVADIVDRHLAFKARNVEEPGAAERRAGQA